MAVINLAFSVILAARRHVIAIRRRSGIMRSMKHYDAIIVLATEPDHLTWKFPQQIYDCLDRAVDLLDRGVAPYAIMSGKVSLSLESKGIQQPFRECDAMADYLKSKGVADSNILLEGDSQDTISNLYYIKKQILIPKGMKHLAFVVADFRIPRLKLLCQRVLGSDYQFEFEPILAEPGPSYNEALTFQIQKDFLEPMKDGDHSWLDGKFFTGSMYEYWRLRSKERHP
jgi:uncharacterized SAM-binding protein YcdF (DUF218 family)